jgi:hypothetical protein
MLLSSSANASKNLRRHRAASKAMQMVRKDNIAIELKRMPLADFVEAFHQERDGLSVSEQRATILGDQREEESAAAHPYPSVTHLTVPILLGLARARPNLQLLR